MTENPILADFYISLQKGPNYADKIFVLESVNAQRRSLKLKVYKSRKPRRMPHQILIAILLLLFSGVFSFLYAQGPEQQAIKPTVLTGEVMSLGENRITISTDRGPIEIVISASTSIRRVSPEKPSLSTATPAQLSDIGTGDRVTVSGILAADGKSMPARSLFLMTKADISQKQAKEAEEWRRRGITGRVKSVNQQTGQLVIEVRGMMGLTDVTLTPKEGAKFLRYAPDSIRFDEALPSSLTDIRVGDMLRALGDRSTDGGSFAAEQVVTGAFQTIAGTVVSYKADTNEIIIKNVQTDKETVIMLGSSSELRRFPAEMAERMAAAQMMMGGGVRPVGGPPAGSMGGRPGGGQAGQQGPSGPGGMGGFRGGNGGVDDLFDRLPAVSASDLRTGEMIAVSCTRNGSVERVKAIKLLAGVEPFIRAAQAAGGGRGMGRPGVDGGFTIPGLDGFGFN